MEIGNLIRCAPRAVGLKPSAIQGEARLRGLESDFWGSPCVPSLVSGIRTPRTPPSPLVGEGVRGMRGKSVRERRKLRPYPAPPRPFTQHSSPPHTIQMKQRSNYLLHRFAGHLTCLTEGIEGVSSGSKVRRHTIQQVAHRGGTQCNPWMKMYPAPKTISRRKHQ
jgi:hypothetical protein